LSQFDRKKQTEQKEKPKQERQKTKRERIQKPQRERVDVSKVSTRRTDGARSKGRGKERFKPIHPEVDQDAIQKQIKETYARMTEGRGRTRGAARHRRENVKL